MRGALVVVLLLASLGMPAPAAAACVSAVPIFPGAQQVGGLATPPLNAGVNTEGRTLWATPAALLELQMFFYIRLTGSGWTEVTQLPGQYPDQFSGGEGRGPVVTTLPVLEFTYGGRGERVRITTEAGGYSVWLECP